VSTHSTEIQRNITEEAGVWSLKGKKNNVAILTATSAPIMTLIELPSWPSWMVMVVDLRREACIPRLAVGGENRSDEREPD
jgi:hypothetical protein